jgi:hypothetical protein
MIGEHDLGMFAVADIAAEGAAYVTSVLVNLLRDALLD